VKIAEEYRQRYSSSEAADQPTAMQSEYGKARGRQGMYITKDAAHVEIFKRQRAL